MFEGRDGQRWTKMDREMDKEINMETEMTDGWKVCERDEHRVQIEMKNMERHGHTVLERHRHRMLEKHSHRVLVRHGYMVIDSTERGAVYIRKHYTE